MDSKQTLAPKRLAEYREQTYWDDRYRAEEGAVYEWLLPYARIRDILAVAPGSRVLVLGCGNSTLAEDIVHDVQASSAVAVDYSSEVVEQMRARCDCPGVEYVCMDIRAMALADGSFDVVVDKATIDTLCTDGGSVWSPSETVRSDVSAALSEVRRLLTRNGRFLSVSFAQPHFRRPLLTEVFSSVSSMEIPDTFYHFYSCSV